MLYRKQPASFCSTARHSGLVAHGFGALQSRIQHEGLADPDLLAILDLAVDRRNFRAVDDPGVSRRLSRGRRGLGLGLAGGWLGA